MLALETSTMLIKPWFEITAILEGRLGRTLIKAGPVGKGTGGSGRIVRKSYTFTNGSGNGRDCLQTQQN
jgi:hypothetical protein